MKYQYKLNDKLLFETNNVSEYVQYLIKNNVATNILHNLLDMNNGYIAEMATLEK